MRDYCLDTLFSLGEACLESEENLARPCIYIKRSSRICQAVGGLYPGPGGAFLLGYLFLGH